jgi:hypothetical protein
MIRDARREYARRIGFIPHRLRTFSVLIVATIGAFLLDSLSGKPGQAPFSPAHFPLTYIFSALLVLIALFEVLLILARFRIRRLADRTYARTRVPSEAMFFRADSIGLTVRGAAGEKTILWADFGGCHPRDGFYLLTTRDNRILPIPTADVDPEPLAFIRQRIAIWGRPGRADVLDS